MARIPLLSGSRVPLVSLADDALRLAPPPPLDPLRDVAGAAVEALRYPLSGSSLADLVTRGGRATIVVEPSALPVPGASSDPRREAVAAVIDELERLGMPAHRHTILIAGGLGRRAGRRELEAVLHRSRARDFRGTVEAHDATSLELRALQLEGAPPVRVHPTLLGADLVVAVTAAETSESGGACAFLGACAAAVIASPAAAPSLLAPSLSPTGVLAGRIAASLAHRTAVTSVSIVLDHPRLTSRYRGYPSSPRAVEALARSPFRRILNTLPAVMRRGALDRTSRELTAVAILAGPPEVAHVEALLRGISLRGVAVHGQLDTIVVPVPWRSLHDPREQPNPITAATAGLGHALRLWRNASPLREGGTIVLLHDLRRTFGHGQAPYRNLFRALREGLSEEELDAAKTAAEADEHALASYREGNSPHPLLPYVDLASCRPAMARAGRVLVAGCRDAGAARALGLVPTHNIPTALEMARGVAGGSHRVGVLLAPPYAPLIVES